MSTALPPDDAGAGGAAFFSLAEAEAWLEGVLRALDSLPRAGLAGAVLRSERAYDQFPELLARFPRRALLRRFRAAAGALPDAEAIPPLLLCAAAEPADSSVLADLLEQAARAQGGAFVSALVRLFRPCAELGWEEIGPAVAAIDAAGADAAAILEILSGILERADIPPERAVALGRVLAPLLLNEPAAIDPAALARAAAGARRRLRETPAGGAGRRETLLARAERVKTRLAPPAPPPGAARPAWPSGEIGISSFLAQWPELALAVPAAELRPHHAVLGADGVLRAENPAAGLFCSGPGLNLPAGRYRVRIVGEAAAGAEYSVEAACRLGGRAAAALCARRYARAGRIAGTLAELAFESDIALRDFQVAVRLARPPADFAIASVAISADRLRPDPED